MSGSPRSIYAAQFSYNVRTQNIRHFSPLPQSIRIGKSEIHGLGLIANIDIELGVDLGISHVKHQGYKDNLIRTPLGGFINHSDSPNCKYQLDGDNLRLITVQSIKKGEEVTVSYRGWYSDEVLGTYK